MNIKKIVVTALVAVMVMVGTAFASTSAMPFAEIPQGHWAYDSLAYCASKGLVSGFPSGEYKGNYSLTRYEAASMVQRAYQKLDTEIATKADQKTVEELQKLAVEFKSELDALGVKVDKIDKRVTVLEKGIGGFKLSGSFMFDANMVSGDNKANGTSAYTDVKGADNWNKGQARLYLDKQIDENTYFKSEFRMGAWANRYEDAWRHRAGLRDEGSKGRGDGNSFSAYQFYVGTKLPISKDGIAMKVGRFQVDYADNAGMVSDNAPLFGRFGIDGFEFSKTWNKLGINALVGRNSDLDYRNYQFNYKDSAYTYALDGTWTFNDRLKFNAVFYQEMGDGKNKGYINTLGTHLKWIPSYGITVKGAWYLQQYGETPRGIYDKFATASKTQYAWEAQLKLEQDLLKVTGFNFIWMGFDNMFSGNTGVMPQYGYSSVATWNTYNQPSILWGKPENNNRSNLFAVIAEQKWKKYPKLTTYERYMMADWGTNGAKDANSWSVYAKYKFSPSIIMGLGFESINYGSGNIHRGSSGYIQNGNDNCLKLDCSVSF